MPGKKVGEGKDGKAEGAGADPVPDSSIMFFIWKGWAVEILSGIEVPIPRRAPAMELPIKPGKVMKKKDNDLLMTPLYRIFLFLFLALFLRLKEKRNHVNQKD